MKKIIVVGLGLIGGSIAKALKRNTNHEILGFDIQEETMLDACSLKVIDRKADLEDIRHADVIFLCTYPKEAIDFVRRYQTDFPSDCIITDTCGIKTYICEQIKKIPGNFVFLGAHPMAGKEKNGFSASDPSIFIGASYIITPCGAPQDAIDKLSTLIRAMGFGKIILTTPEKHDRVIAFTSQLPHVLACAYVLSPTCEFHCGFSAGSYRDVSRVADINAELWTHLFIENKEELTKEIDILIHNLALFRDTLVEDKKGNLNELLQKAANIKRRDHV